MSTEAVMVDVIRTPVGRGKPGGILSGVHPVDLLAGVLDALVSRNDLDPACSTTSSADASPRSASRGQHHPQRGPRRGVPRDRARHDHRPPVRLEPAGRDLRRAGRDRRPGRHRHRLRCRVDEPGPARLRRGGYRSLGPRLRARYPDGLVGQGVSAELIAAKWGFSRAELDEFAARSHRLAAAAGESGAFATEVVPVPGVSVLADETIRPATTAESLAGLNPAFRTDALTERFPDSTGGSRPATPHRSPTGHPPR